MGKNKGKAKKPQGPGAKKPGKGKGKGTEHRRKETRKDLKDAKKRAQKHAHGKEVDATRQRLRRKLLERQLARGTGAQPGEQRRELLVELGSLHGREGRHKGAMQCLQEALDIEPLDANFAVRHKLLCLYMERAMTEEATALLKGPLFSAVWAGELPELQTAQEHEAYTAGCYSLALLSYISVRVLQEPKAKALLAAEQRLTERLRRAHQQNPFVAELIAFAPAFEAIFPFGCELPGRESAEDPLLEALGYCCQLGLRGQAPVWLDTNRRVRRFIRESLFEGEGDSAPLSPLPTSPARERWSRGREEAMRLWAAEMARDAGLVEEAVEEEELTDDELLND